MTAFVPPYGHPILRRGAKPMSDIVVFEGGARAVEVRLEGETLWLTLQRIADLFGRDKSVVPRHLRNVFAAGELAREAAVAKNATTAADGKPGGWARRSMLTDQNRQGGYGPAALTCVITHNIASRPRRTFIVHLLRTMVLHE